MKDNRLIAVHQFTILVAFYGIGTSIVLLPGLLASFARQDAWIACLAGTLATCVPIAIYVSLARLYPGKTLVEINARVFGTWLGGGISLLYIHFFLVLTVLMLGDFGYFLTTEVMPETPLSFFAICITVVVVMGARLGPEVIARGAEVFFPWVLLLMILLVSFTLPKMETDRLLPILEYGWQQPAKGALPMITLHEYVVLLMLYPYVKNAKKAALAFFAGHGFASFVLLLFILLCLTVLGPDLTAANIYPTFTLAKKVSVGEFLQRVEVVIGGIWFITIVFKIVLAFFATVTGISQTFQLRNYTFLTIPLGMLVVALVPIIEPNIVYQADFTKRIWPAYTVTFIFALPAATLAVAWLKSGWRKPVNEYNGNRTEGSGQG